MKILIGLLIIALCAVAWALFHELNRTDDIDDE